MRGTKAEWAEKYTGAKKSEDGAVFPAPENRYDDMVLGPPNSARNLIKDDHSSSRVQFLTNYHTTLVATMAIALGTATYD